jgi:3-hydroxymyristoyl/3-hydroxydecanoyl-(acyl carrier protein) dehydratase
MTPGSVLADVVVAAGEARATLPVARAVELCQGHFPGAPILPGATLVGLMAEVAAAVAGRPGRAPAEVVRAVFLHGVAPSAPVTFMARPDGDRIVAEVRAAGATVARAAFRFEDG